VYKHRQHEKFLLKVVNPVAKGNNRDYWPDFPQGNCTGEGYFVLLKIGDYGGINE